MNLSELRIYQQFPEDLTMNLSVISEREFQENTFRMGRS